MRNGRKMSVEAKGFVAKSGLYHWLVNLPENVIFIVK